MTTNIWRPYTQMQYFENGDTIPLIQKGEGIYLSDSKGNKYIDGISSWWVNSIGHGNERVAAAIHKQAKELEHVIFANFTHQPAEKLSEKVLKLLPDNISKIFYSDNGSTSVEIGLKIAYQYWRNQGYSEKTKFCSLRNSYHGDTVGAMSVGGIKLFHSLYNNLFFDVLKIDEPDCFNCPLKLSKNSCSIDCLSLVDNIFSKYSEQISAFIIEPVVLAAGGMIIYPPEYLSGLSELCLKYNILLIVDEVATGFGRTGKMFASQHANISADIYCLAKSLTGGYLPLAITACSSKIYDAFLSDSDKHKTFYHGHSFTANPIACAAAIESIDIMEELFLLDNVNHNEPYLRNNFIKFDEHYNYVYNPRGIGHIWAFNLKTENNNLPGIIQRLAMDSGLFIRPLANVVYIWLPLITTLEELYNITGVLDMVLAKVGQE